MDAVKADHAQMEAGKMWKEIESKVKDSVMKEEKKIIPWKLGKKKWHNKECRKKKRELRKEFRRMKRGRISKEEYVIKEWSIKDGAIRKGKSTRK